MGRGICVKDLVWSKHHLTVPCFAMDPTLPSFGGELADEFRRLAQAVRQQRNAGRAHAGGVMDRA